MTITITDGHLDEAITTKIARSSAINDGLMHFLQSQ